MRGFQHSSTGQSFEDLDPDSDFLPETQYVIRPGSTISSFSLEIILPFAASLPPSSEGKRGIAPLQPGGRLLLYDTVPLGGSRVQILLTLHSDTAPDTYRVVGQLIGKSLPQRVEAYLQVGKQAYHVHAEGGRFEIQGVEFGEALETSIISSCNARLGTIEATSELIRRCSAGYDG
jgi:hypothetical protein